MQWALEVGEQLADDVQHAKRIIRSDDFFNGETSYAAFDTIIQCLEVASLPYYPASLTLQSYISAYPVDSSKGVLRAVRDENHNIFLDIFRRGILEDIKREQPDVIGISIPSMPQMLAGMTLGYLIKQEAQLDCHVVVGRGHTSVCCVTNSKKYRLSSSYSIALSSLMVKSHCYNLCRQLKTGMT